MDNKINLDVEAPGKILLPDNRSEGRLACLNIEQRLTTVYDVNSESSQNEMKAVELFSSFTANIIKEETLFIR